MAQNPNPYVESSEHEEIKSQNKNIDTYIENLRKMERKPKKVLLLGTRSSGKSTLFKQLQQIYKYDLHGVHFERAKCDIRNNCFHSLFNLLNKSQILYEMDNKTHSDCFIDLEQNPIIIEHIKTVLEYVSPHRFIGFEVQAMDQWTERLYHFI